SGGVDSALTLAIAVDALGADRVHAVMMPSEFTAGMSIDDTREMVATAGVHYSELPIKSLFELFLNELAPLFTDKTAGVTEENIQARVRGTLLMALSNKYGQLVVTTGNKSEMAVGYATLYGDMAGGFALLRDVPKTLVYRLCRYRNAITPLIPQRVIDRPPSAELRPDQTDQDSLPEYAVLDAIIERYAEWDQTIATIVAAGYDETEVRRVVRMIDRSEYKRRQAAVGVRITPRGFGKDRRYPITNRFDAGPSY
ncbi:MAG: NAD(+) synthase, partial [Burkholderiales bacterium]